MTDYLEFNTEEIHRIASATRGHQAQWDQIWNSVRSRLSDVVVSALDSQTGGSLDRRNAEYHKKTTGYNVQLQNQMSAVSNVGNIATEYGHAMTRTVAGGRQS